jgi:hypothetical protein
VRQFELEHENGDQNGDHAIAEGLDATLGHAGGISLEGKLCR